ncbi:unnamed protein product [Orchesella dallaii]|uniref:DOMON domain-containing protein n=1 Tax=Orchesella dallaii TaxID=48710 RepID=A0ABP1PKW0_9HEXA
MIFTGVSLILSLLGGGTNTNVSVGVGSVGNSAIVNIPQISPVNLQPKENPFKHSVTLDPRGNYRLEWEVDWKEERVIFNVTAATKGYIGFGLSRKGKMSGADIVIGGVDKNGKPYFSDRHAIGNQLPVLDQNQDWILHEAWERGGLTFLSFSRPFDTCDKVGDLVINENDLVSVIWAFGENDNDELQNHWENRGSYEVYLLDPDLAPESLSDRFRFGNQGKLPQISKTFDVLANFQSSINVFRISEVRTLFQQDTLYWCSFHRVPTSTKHHIIGFNVEFPTEKDRVNVHHLLLYRCVAPPGSSALQNLTQSSLNGGGECYLGDDIGPPSISFCTEEIFAWGVGGRALFLPNHVGIPMSESNQEFFMLQVHYDNSNKKIPSEITVSIALNIYYTNNLRENDAGIILVGSAVPSSTSLVIPPYSRNHIILGHCSKECTKKMLNSGGIKVFAAFGHTHVAGREVRLRHFRNSKELSWIGADSNYNFAFQQMRLLKTERRIEPGDHLVQTCVYDSTGRNGTVVTGGYSTREEMCLMHLYYYARVNGIGNCLSEIREEGYNWNLLGIKNTTFAFHNRETVIREPSQFVGVTISNYLTNFIEWSEELKKEFQRQHIIQPQISVCPTISSSLGGISSQPINNVRNNFVNEKKKRKPEYIERKTGTKSRDYVRSNRVGRSIKYPARLHYNFNLKNENGIRNGTSKKPSDWEGYPEPILSVSEHQSRFPREFNGYQPESRCGWEYYEAPVQEKHIIINVQRERTKGYTDYDKSIIFERNPDGSIEAILK